MPSYSEIEEAIERLEKEFPYIGNPKSVADDVWSLIADHRRLRDKVHEQSKIMAFISGSVVIQAREAAGFGMAVRTTVREALGKEGVK